ncbi:hypothetical protein GE061_004727 [Apolygus lucorum]|uniref:Uncharacterized protein n=1 Tax=Apolygus lucorum TaxID=248454 RepID=A0A8S9X1I6_APOLU|nr:hypothetical protein GE061_004727 [Apolygus lucorum]
MFLIDGHSPTSELNRSARIIRTIRHDATSRTPVDWLGIEEGRWRRSSEEDPVISYEDVHQSWRPPWESTDTVAVPKAFSGAEVSISDERCEQGFLPADSFASQVWPDELRHSQAQHLEGLQGQKEAQMEGM